MVSYLRSQQSVKTCHFIELDLHNFGVSKLLLNLRNNLKKPFSFGHLGNLC